MAEQQQQQQQQQGMAAMREYRKGNWTVQETMILIEAKKMDDERRKLNKKQTYQNIITITSPSGSSSTTSPSSSTSSLMAKPVTELRWKWVEEYCWRKGCLRSQNQCNDKWDNLMRDYKKIRDYQRGLLLLSADHPEIITKSYWDMDKLERKDKSLPTNMLPQIYQALFEVVDQTTTVTATATATATAGMPATTQFLQLPSPPPSVLLPPPPPPPRPQAQLPFYSQQPPQLLPTLEPETSEHVQQESPAKRRRKEERIAPVVGEGTSSGAATTTPHQMATTPTPTPTPTTQTTQLQEVSSSIYRNASVIAEAIQSNEEKKERRHKEIMHIHETRLRLEESKLEVIRHGFSGLNDAINKLSNSILNLASNSHKSQQGP